ncbi:hypothetical protein GCM10010508_45740 [Streptomyces naganishii JCM 4654]|uniref:Uncharacterized protein n=1 Tax=Streptomyces naganishii JCM 4654 TaxID=1306179 RepID=A0A919CXG4_9ACTN|nr:hypothetical protein GCM10010508_45740 [Streptomyces naganishii JCM 4654]
MKAGERSHRTQRRGTREGSSPAIPSGASQAAQDPLQERVRDVPFRRDGPGPHRAAALANRRFHNRPYRATGARRDAHGAVVRPGSVENGRTRAP